MKNLVYQATDEELTDGTSYYRIKAISTTDNYIYSKIVSVENNSNNSVSYSLSPNPAKDNFMIKGNGISRVELIDGIGKIVKNITFNNVNNLVVNIEGITRGVYIVSITDNKSEVHAKKMIVE